MKKHNRYPNQVKSDKEKEYDNMAEHPDIKAVRRFRTPAYGAVRMIRAQGEQVEKKSGGTDD